MFTCRHNTSHARRRAALALTGCALSAVLVAATLEPQLPELDEVQVTAKVLWPLEDYIEFPTLDIVAISPGGTHLATGWGEQSLHRRVSIHDWPSMQTRSTELLQRYFGTTDLRWLDEDRLLIQPDWPSPGLWRVRSHVGTLQIRDINGWILQELHPTEYGFANVFENQRLVEEIAKRVPPKLKRDAAIGPLRLVAARTGGKDQLLFQTLWNGRGSDADDSYGIYRLDMTTWQQTRIAALPLRGGQAITGAGNRVALVAGFNEADEHVVYFLPEGAGIRIKDWQLRVRSGSGQRGLLPLAWAGQDEQYYALDGRDLPTRAVVVWNARDNTQRLLYRHPDADMDAAWFDPAGKPWMFSGLGHDAVYWYPDAAHPLAQLHRALTRALRHDHVDILSATDDLSKAVVRISSGQRPPVFLVADVKTGNALTKVAETYPKLRGRRRAPVEAIQFRARDGLEIRGYLTTPLDPEGKPRRGAPLLVIAHNGPRDGMVDYRYIAHDQYEFERQAFASRGYAVLQVNTRGIGGHGAAFEQAGDGKWGREVQDDYADGVRWAIQEGVAAGGRTCFYGTGYGAYSGLMAAARNPELFQCVIGVGGIYDLPRLMDGDRNAGKYGAPPGVSTEVNSWTPQKVPDQNKRVISSQMIADVETTLNFVWAQDRLGKKIPPLLQRAFSDNLDDLRARSPVTHAASIKAKVLLLHQHMDLQAPEAQFVAMRDALRAAGNRPQTDTIGNEDGGQWEGYFTLQTRTAVYKKMLSFLDKQIGH